MALLPYENTIHQLKYSHISGMSVTFANDLEKIAEFNNEKYKMYNNTVNEAKNNLVKDVIEFLDRTHDFLFVFYPEKEPHRMTLPLNLKNNPENENKFREQQGATEKAAQTLIISYELFVKIFKENGFISEKLWVSKNG